MPGPAIERSDTYRCPMCMGAGWIWGHELKHSRDHSTDTRYSCEHPQCDKGKIKVGWTGSKCRYCDEDLKVEDGFLVCDGCGDVSVMF